MNIQTATEEDDEKNRVVLENSVLSGNGDNQIILIADSTKFSKFTTVKNTF